MKRLVLAGLMCLLFCLPMLADPCPASGGISTYSDLICQVGPFTLEIGQISVNFHMQNTPNPQIFIGPNILYDFRMGISNVGVLHPGEFFDMTVPITYIIPPCCTIESFSSEITNQQGCCVDIQIGLAGMMLHANESGTGDLSWDLAEGSAPYTVPEPALLGLLSAGLAASVAARRPRRQPSPDHPRSA